VKILDQIFDRTLSGVEKALDLRMRRHQALSANVANVDTPQYRAVELSFAGELKRAFSEPSEELLRTNSKHLDLVEDSGAHLVSDFSGATKADGNNVDLDLQLAKMNANMSKYTGAAQILQARYRNVRMLLREVM
jgi:flagellar basal-body rod protein FlgB